MNRSRSAPEMCAPGSKLRDEPRSPLQNQIRTFSTGDPNSLTRSAGVYPSIFVCWIAWTRSTRDRIDSWERFRLRAIALMDIAPTCSRTKESSLIVHGRRAWFHPWRRASVLKIYRGHPVRRSRRSRWALICVFVPAPYASCSSLRSSGVNLRLVRPSVLPGSDILFFVSGEQPRNDRVFPYPVGGLAAIPGLRGVQVQQDVPQVMPEIILKNFRAAARTPQPEILVFPPSPLEFQTACPRPRRQFCQVSPRPRRQFGPSGHFEVRVLSPVLVKDQQYPCPCFWLQQPGDAPPGINREKSKSTPSQLRPHHDFQPRVSEK